MSEVVLLNKNIAHPAEPVEDIVKCVNALLREAKAGVRAIAYAVVDRQGNIAEGWQNADGTRFSLLAAVNVLQHRIVMKLDENSLATTTFEE